MKSKVFFADLRADSKRNLPAKLGELMLKAGIKDCYKKGNLVAIKMHFGEKGNTAYVSPVFVRRIVDAIKETGADPFLTDTNTLYMGTRGNSVAHIRTAIENGFAYAVIGAPVIIADGLKGEAGVPVEVNGKHYKEVLIARDIVNANAMFALTHFKCHEMSGFGGALKNIGMGCASREGKLSQHSNAAPLVDASGCTACSECAAVCPANAISITDVALIDAKTCIGCGHCIPACPQATIHVQWDETTARLQEKMAEHAAGALKGKLGKCLFVNFITHVSPACDCYGHNDAPVVHDIGILSSTDPVAIDQACADLVNNAQGIPSSCLKGGHEPGGDKFRGVHPSVDWNIQLDRAQALGLGTRAYALVKI